MLSWVCMVIEKLKYDNCVPFFAEEAHSNMKSINC